MAEWLRRWTANPLCSARAGSSPAGVVIGSIAQLGERETEDLNGLRSIRSWPIF